jgi:hypothetical protein
LDAAAHDQHERQEASQNLRVEKPEDYGLERLLLTQATFLEATYASVIPATFSLRKEVIQPQVLLRLPCYDFTPIMDHTLGRCLLAVSLQTSSTIHFRDVTGGVYKKSPR